MQHALLVGGGEARRRPAARCRGPCPAGRRPIRRRSDARFSPSTNSIDRKCWPSASADVADAADRRVRDLARHAHLAVEAGRGARRRRSSAVGQELEGDRLLELQVVGAVDLAHPAAAEKADDAVAPAEDGAGREALAGAGSAEPGWPVDGASGCPAGDGESGRGDDRAGRRAGRAVRRCRGRSRTTGRSGSAAGDRGRAGGTGAHRRFGHVDRTIRCAAAEIRHEPRRR